MTDDVAAAVDAWLDRTAAQLAWPRAAVRDALISVMNAYSAATLSGPPNDRLLAEVLRELEGDAHCAACEHPLGWPPAARRCSSCGWNRRCTICEAPCDEPRPDDGTTCGSTACLTQAERERDL